MGESVFAAGVLAEPPDPPLSGELLSIGCEKIADEIVLTLTGELDIATAGPAVGYVRDVLERHDRPVVLDLASLRFCDARGLGALVRMSKDAEQAGLALRLMLPQPPGPEDHAHHEPEQ